MTYDRKALEALLEKVLAGSDDTPDFSALVSRPIMQCKAGEAYRGSLDAALALHNAVLPDWGCVLNTYRNWARVWDQDDEDCPSHEEVSVHSPARAWLVVILRALIAQAEGES